MNGYRFKISLRVRHPSIDPAEITKALGKEPTRAWQTGRPRTTSKGDLRAETYRETYWTSKLREGGLVLDDRSSEGEDLAQAIEAMLLDLAGHKQFFQELRAGGGQVEFFVGWFFDGNIGEVFRHDLLGRLADLKIDLSLDVYTRERAAPEPPSPPE